MKCPIDNVAAVALRPFVGSSSPPTLSLLNGLHKWLGSGAYTCHLQNGLCSSTNHTYSLDYRLYSISLSWPWENCLFRPLLVATTSPVQPLYKRGKKYIYIGDLYSISWGGSTYIFDWAHSLVFCLGLGGLRWALCLRLVGMMMSVGRHNMHT